MCSIRQTYPQFGSQNSKIPKVSQSQSAGSQYQWRLRFNNTNYNSLRHDSGCCPAGIVLLGACTHILCAYYLYTYILYILYTIYLHTCPYTQANLTRSSRNRRGCIYPAARFSRPSRIIFMPTR